MLPLAISLAALVLSNTVILAVGITQPEYEDPPARIIQILVLVQVALSIYFSVRLLPCCPWPGILVLQVAAAHTAVATVVRLESSV